MRLTKEELALIAKTRQQKNAAKKTAKVVKTKTVKAPKAEKKAKVTKPVHVKKVERKIAKMTDQTLAKKAAKLLAESPNKNNRVGEDCTMAEKNQMVAMQAAKLSYRMIERVYDMLPANGMNAFRCVEDAKAHNRAEKVRQTRAANKVADAAVSAPVVTPAPVVEAAKVETPVAAPVVTETAPAVVTPAEVTAAAPTAEVATVVE